jgi:hypothetical protein
MSEQAPGSAPTQDEAAIAAEYYDQSVAAATDMVENYNQHAPIQQGVEHGPHRLPVEAGDATSAQFEEHDAKRREAKMDGYISTEASNQLFKENYNRPGERAKRDARRRELAARIPEPLNTSVFPLRDKDGILRGVDTGTRDYSDNQDAYQKLAVEDAVAAGHDIEFGGAHFEGKKPDESQPEQPIEPKEPQLQ